MFIALSAFLINSDSYGLNVNGLAPITESPFVVRKDDPSQEPK